MGPGRPGRERGSVGDEVQRASRVIAVPASIDMVTLLGPRDAFLRVLEEQLEADLHVRGSQVTVTGAPEDVASAVEILTELITIIRTGQGLTEETVERVIGLAADDLKPSEILTSDIISARGRTVRPKTLNQKRYVDAIDRHTVVFGIGPAGTGKTFLAVACAIDALDRDQVERIILTRPAVEAGERLGFLPGDLTQKIDPYLRPLFDALNELMGPERVGKLIERQQIEIAPLAYMRGRTLSNAFIILDEAQNTTPEQMKMFLTRIGFGSKAVITGDITQIDLPAPRKSGLVQAQRVLKNVKGIAFNRFESGDVVRHPLVARIVEAYEKHVENRKRTDA